MTGKEAGRRLLIVLIRARRRASGWRWDKAGKYWMVRGRVAGGEADGAGGGWRWPTADT